MYYDTLKGLPGIQIGSKRSQIHLLCYEKIDAYGNKSQKFKGQSKFIKINPNNHKRFLRIESRYRPNAKPTSKNGRPMMLADLLTMKNPFERLQVYSKDMPHQLLGKGFIFEIPNEPSLGRLKQYILKDMQYSRLPRNIINEIKKHKIDLFNKHNFWYRWPLLVKKIGCILDIAQEYSSKE
ncbi:hypothetical protein [Dickeya aquatica]|uniref:hypothetical protein n=1 Tax=Dickeya aquatica TaxID=1401087 RepID=UPI00068700D1|nr:hypothetical protein [Dickeya aquatica]